MHLLQHSAEGQDAEEVITKCSQFRDNMRTGWKECGGNLFSF